MATAISPPPTQRRPAGRDPDSAEALNSRGVAHYQGGDDRAALAAFTAALAARPDYAVAANNRGLVRTRLGDHAAAIADFGTAVQLDPGYADAFGNRALALRAAGRLAEALADADRAVALSDPASAALALYNRGILRDEGGDSAGAVADFDRAIPLDPSHGPAYAARGAARRRLGLLDDALADYDRALELLPVGHAAAAYHGRAAVHADRLDFRSAVEDCEAALRIDPRFATAHLSKGHARYHCGDPRGVLDYCRALEIDPAGAAAEVARVVAEHARQDADGVLGNCDKHLRRDAEDVSARVRRGLTLLYLGREPEARTDFDHALGRMPAFRRHLDLVREAVRRVRPGIGADPAGGAVCSPGPGDFSDWCPDYQAGIYVG